MAQVDNARDRVKARLENKALGKVPQEAESKGKPDSKSRVCTKIAGVHVCHAHAWNRIRKVACERIGTPVFFVACIRPRL